MADSKYCSVEVVCGSKKNTWHLTNEDWSSTPVEQLYKMVSEHFNLDVDQLRLSYKGRDLPSKGKTLEDCEFEHPSTVVVYMRVNGGAHYKLQGRKIGESIETTDEECIISLYDEGPNMKLPCGHAIEPNSLAVYVKKEVSKGQSKLNCPTCKKEWNVSIIKRMGLTDEEIKAMEVGLSKNYLLKEESKCKECPWCGLLLEKYNDGIRMMCPMCKKEFCWRCMHQWKAPGSGYRDCGNLNCGKHTDLIHLLVNCEDTKMEYSGQVVPSIRACIGCGATINHIAGCKHMKCPIAKCKKEFCFVCLNPWPCGSSVGKECKVAPRQAKLPTK